MSSPDDRSDARSVSDGGAGTATRDVLDERDARGSSSRSAEGVSAGSTRTPPPRTRRGAPVGRAVTDTDLVEPIVTEPDPTTAAPKSPSQREPKSNAASAAPFTLGATSPAIDEPPLDPAFEPAFEPSRKVRPAKAKRQERRFRQTIVKVDLWSVTKLALCFYVSAMGVVIVALIALWTVAESTGVIDNVENFIGDLFSSEDFQFVSGEVLRGAVLGAVVLVALMVAFTIIAASFYNIFSELFGGLEVVIREEEQPPKR